MKDGFVKVAAATPRIRVADCAYNASRVEAMAAKAAEQGAALCVFPALCVTASTCGDLFLQHTLQRGAEQALARILTASARHAMVMVVGLPFAHGGALYNAAAVMCRGKLLGIVPKTGLSAEESRQFASGSGLEPVSVRVCGQDTLFGDGLLFRCASMPAFVLGCEIGEDMALPLSPGAQLCVSGATVIAHPSASPALVGKTAYRREAVKNLAARLVCGYVSAEAGRGESTQDLVFSGHNVIAENGHILAQSEPFSTGILYSELDLSVLLHERRRSAAFAPRQSGCTAVAFDLPQRDTTLTRSYPQLAFVPSDRDELESRCAEIIRMQATGLATRMQHARTKTALIGLSGGLDSTLALIVMVHAFDLLGIDRSGIHAVTMPCFGTTSRTKSNAVRLAECYGATLHTVDIQAAVRQHFSDIGHDPNDHSVTFENAQARMRTLVLMSLANQLGGLVVGTGDLSELALGWATYNGDHMSMYGVNASVPKTLVRYLTAFEAARAEKTLQAVLLDVLGTPVSPELLPPKDGEISQKTEELVGPYELHDFFLFYMVRYGFSPRKIFRLARLAFDEVYTDEIMKKWLITFVRRFFTQQFKRSCLPDGAKVGSVSLSPRGDYVMPSDAVSELWLSEAESL